MNSEFYEDQFSSKLMLGIPVMGIDTDGSVVIDGQRTRTDVKDLSIESAGVFVLPLSSEHGSTTITTQYEEIVFEDFDHFLTCDISKYASIITGDREEMDDLCCISDIEINNKINTKKNVKISQKFNVTHTAYKCKICFKDFLSKIELSEHKGEHGGASRWKCVICEKCFSQQSNLWKHMRSHTGERPFICDICNKGFTQLANLQKHKLVHTGEKPFNCPECGKGFSQQANMLKHQSLHTGEKPFACQSCNKSFAQKSNLAKHELLHTGEKPHTCKTCSKSFTQQSNLKKHECRHIDHRPFICELCDKRYIQKISLERHKIKCAGSSISYDTGISEKKSVRISISDNDNNYLTIVAIKSEN